MMPDIVIADTSCFIILANINELDLLHKVFGNIITTPEIASEYGNELPVWVNIKSSADIQKQQILETQVDKGEASAIALALDIPGCMIIVDDLEARLLAQKLNILITGTLGVIIQAKLMGLIPSIKPLLNKIRQTSFRLSNTLEEIAIKQAGE
jgi:predicted nucleic acid-binding protein